jgi:hypothetical protein
MSLNNPATSRKGSEEVADSFERTSSPSPPYHSGSRGELSKRDLRIDTTHDIAAERRASITISSLDLATTVIIDSTAQPSSQELVQPPEWTIARPVSPRHLPRAGAVAGRLEVLDPATVPASPAHLVPEGSEWFFTSRHVACTSSATTPPEPLELFGFLSTYDAPAAYTDEGDVCLDAYPIAIEPETPSILRSDKDSRSQSQTWVARPCCAASPFLPFDPKAVRGHTGMPLAPQSIFFQSPIPKEDAQPPCYMTGHPNSYYGHPIWKAKLC